MIPQCLLNSGTVIRNRNTNSIIFIAKYLMNSGLLGKTLKFLNYSLSKPFHHNLPVFFAKSKDLSLKLASNEKVESLIMNQKHVNSSNTFSILNSRLATLKPIFHYFIYKVDKQIYKNSRGRSGKYTFIWKYLTTFKRINFIIFNLTKEIKLDYSKDFNARINNCLLKYLTNPKATLISRSIRFSNNYVFLGGKSNLLQNYRTTKSS